MGGFAVVLDIDGTLLNLPECAAEEVFRRLPDFPWRPWHRYSSLVEEVSAYIGESVQQVASWMFSEAVLMRVQPYAGAQEAITMLYRAGVRLPVVTSRHENRYRLTAESLSRFFPELRESELIIGARGGWGINSKTHHARRLGAKVVVDDRALTIEEHLARENAGSDLIAAVLLDRSWNQRELVCNNDPRFRRFGDSNNGNSGLLDFANFVLEIREQV